MVTKHHLLTIHSSPTVDGRNSANLLRLVVYPIFGGF